MSKMFVNVIHRADPGPVMLEALRFQQDEAHRSGIRTTILLQYPAFFDREMVEYIKEQKDRFGDEVGIHFHELMHEDLQGVAESREPALYLHSVKSKKAIILRMFEKFKEIFGFIPTAVADYILDTPSLKIIREHYPEVKVAITNCFEEGVKMFEGNNRGWYLFSDGGPWSAYYPAVENFLCPAYGKSDEVGIVGLPHLNRDMILAITSRDDYFASHPVNVVRAKANNGPDSPYIRRFIDKWIEQADYNGFSYYSLFVSCPWLTPGNMFVESWEDARALYTDSLRYLKKRIDDGKVEAMTMTGFADWYSINVGAGQPEVNLWDDLLCGTKRQMFWYVDAYFRSAIDLNLSGTICDFRPYTGRLEKNLGPDTVSLWNGNYPFLISSEHRSGSSHTCHLSCNGHSASIGDKRSKGRVEKTEAGKPRLVVEPITVRLGDITATLQSSFTFEGQGRILIERKLLEVSDSNAGIQLTEYHKGCWGTTMYPEDMRGIELSVARGSGEASKLSYEYRTRSISVPGSDSAHAAIPQIKTRVGLSAVEGAEAVRAEEGCLFNPFYVLAVEKRVAKGGSMKVCLTIEKL